MEARIEGNDQTGYFLVINTDDLTETKEYEIIQELVQGLEDGTYVWNYNVQNWDTDGVWLSIPSSVVLGYN